MGSSTKKHKKDRISRKHKHRSQSSSSEYSPEPKRFKEHENDRRRHHKHRSRTRSPNKISTQFKIKEKDKKHRHHHKKHKERRHKHHNHSKERIHDDYNSDSSDVIEVPLTPPAPPVISQQQSRTPIKTKKISTEDVIIIDEPTIIPPAPVISQRKVRTPSPIPESGLGDSLSITETNKLRAKLGLKPLEVETSVSIDKSSSGKKNENGLSTYKDDWGEFVHKPANNLAEKLQTEKIREKIKQKKEKRALESKLKKVKGLGESDDEVDDVKKWVQKSKKKEELRKEAEKRAKVLEEMDEEFSVGNIIEQDVRDIKRESYKARDLKGLRIEHDFEEFKEGKTVILTLKDNEVLNKDGDTLVNVNIVDEEHYRKNVVNKKLNPQFYGYNVFEENVDEYGDMIERSILEKYDDVEGNKKKSFTIGENIEEEKAQKRRLLEIKSKLAGKRLERLDDILLKPASDTYTPTEMEKFKKPKRKVKKQRQKLKAEDLFPLSNQINGNRDLGHRKRQDLQTDDIVISNPEELSNIKVESEDEEVLERVLSKARRLKQKESIIRKPLSIEPNNIKPEIKNESDDESSNHANDGNIVLNATAEFCRTLGDIPTYGMAGNRDEETNELMDYNNETIQPEVNYEEPEPSTGTWNSVNPDAIMKETDDNSNDFVEVAILDEEPDVGLGVAAALKLAVSKGYLEKDDLNRPSNTRMAHLQAKNYSIEDKSYGDEDRFGRRDRFHSGPIMDFREKDTFKPNVKLDYIDDNGRILNAKEAFRYLSHKFHGKGPSKNKIEKRLKKVEQEGLMKKMSSTDTPLGTLNMLQQKQKETHAPFVVLSGGKSQVGTSISKHK